MLHRGHPSRARTNRRYVASHGPCIFPPYKYLFLSGGQTYPLRFHLLSFSPFSPPPHLELACLLARGCSSAARHGCCRGCSPSRSPCSLVAPRTSAHLVQCLRWGTGDFDAPPVTSASMSSSSTMNLYFAHKNTRWCKCFTSMLQKVDRDVAHVVIAICVCFKCRFQLFHLVQTYITSVSSECYKSRSGYYIYIYIQVF
jgi:hypothetical protein